MQLPLPKTVVDNLSGLDTPNLSLKYYKWADVYEDNYRSVKNDKSAFLKGFVRLSGKKDYAEAFDIRKKHLERMGCHFSLTTATRLLFGTGYQHPLEIGFMFDWTTGLPVIPGSSLKGIAKDVSIKDDLPELDGKCDPNEIFGTPACVGRIVFLPAYPELSGGNAFFELDVTTPHYKKYFEDPENPPADYYSPVPLHFLTVPKGIKYTFRLADRKNLMDASSPLLEPAQKILTFALTKLGAGAKSSIYGYFE